MHLIKNIKKGTKILDAGCGAGNEAILSGLLGGKITGIDINKTRLNLAKKRVAYYENRFNKKIDAEFYLKNIFNHRGEYDIIWAEEAISHINPAEKFIYYSFKNLKIGGKLIIADQNNLNPMVYIKRRKVQKKEGGSIITVIDPDTGEEILYAIERYFTIPSIKKLMSQFFKKIEIYPIGYIPYSIYRKNNMITRIIERDFLTKMPILKILSGAYVIIGTKMNS